MVRKQARLGGLFIVCEKTMFCVSRLVNESARSLKMSCPAVLIIELTAASHLSLCSKPCNILLSVGSNHFVQC